MILLLSSILFISNANAVDISLVNSIGIHTFDYDDTGNVLISKGSVPIENQDKENSIHITLSTSNDLLNTDLGPNREPRKHNINQKVYFYPLVDTSWVEFEEDSFTIPPASVRIANYTLVIPVDELPSYVNATNGFIGYIKIICGSEPTSGSGASVGVKYTYKLFVIFHETFPFPIPLYYIISVIVLSIALIYLVIRLRIKDKKKSKHL